MWFNETSSTSSKPRRRRKNQRKSREPLLTVHARSPEKRKERTHRRAAVALLIALVAGTAVLARAGTQWMGRSLYSANPQFEIRQILVNNPGGRLSAQYVIENAKVRAGANLFATDLAEVRSNLESAPLVRSVLVQRRLPDTLEISIVERIPVARLDQHLSVDLDGHVLGLRSVPASLPAIVGFQRPGLRPGSFISDKRFEAALRLIDLCETTRLGSYLKIVEIGVGDPESLELKLASGERVLLPRGNLEASLRDVVDVLRNAEARGLRYTQIDAFSSKNVVAR